MKCICRDGGKVEIHAVVVDDATKIKVNMSFKTLIQNLFILSIVL